jgi:uncharacterized membrane protein YsdA (DUF1294 family)
MNGFTLIAGWYALLSIIAFIAYGIDKLAAVRGGWRIGEKQLHFWALAGGFPGAWLGQRAFRHKSRKTRFMVVFWLIVSLHAIGWGIWKWQVL